MKYFVAHEESPTAYSMQAEPLPSYTAAMEALAREESLKTPQPVLIHTGIQWTANPERGSRGRVLLDLSSVPMTETAIGAVLRDDPVVRAVFELGRRFGQMEAVPQRYALGREVEA